MPAYFTLDLATTCMSPLADKETWHLLPTAPAILPTTTKYFDRAAMATLATLLTVHCRDVAVMGRMKCFKIKLFVLDLLKGFFFGYFCFVGPSRAEAKVGSRKREF